MEKIIALNEDEIRKVINLFDSVDEGFDAVEAIQDGKATELLDELAESENNRLIATITELGDIAAEGADVHRRKAA